jgi:predicted esterase
MRPLCSRLVLLSALVATQAQGAQTAVLPAWICAHPDAVFAGAFEAGQNAIPSNPSRGSGGAYPGAKTRHLHIVGLGSGTQTYFLYLPGNYTPARSWPLLLALHGVAPNDGGSYAATVRDTWAVVAATAGFIVAAPVADEVVDVGGQSGITWSVPPSSGPTDYDLFAAVRTDVEGAYNIERTRRYGWGFSAGANVMHDLGVNQYSSAFNSATMAAYGVGAGDLAGLACQGLNDAQCSGLLAALPRKIPVDIHVGIFDTYYLQPTIHDQNRFLAQGWITGQTVFWTGFNGGHNYTATDLQQVWTNLCPNAVVP